MQVESWVVIPKEKVDAVREFGLPIAKDVYVGPGRQAEFRVRVDDLPEYLIERLTGDRTAPAPSNASGVRADVGGSHRSPMNYDTVLVARAGDYQFARGTARHNIYECVRLFDGNPFKRGELIAKCREFTPLKDALISSTISHMVHSENILKIVS